VDQGVWGSSLLHATFSYIFKNTYTFSKELRDKTTARLGRPVGGSFIHLYILSNLDESTVDETYPVSNVKD